MGGEGVTHSFDIIYVYLARHARCFQQGRERSQETLILSAEPEAMKINKAR